MTTGGYQHIEDLPQTLAVFPLDGAIVLPGGQLPLNIFEPRYLNMIDDAMAGERLIGMVQTQGGGDRARPDLARVGCVGKITSFSETADGRYLITLTGVCRFRLVQELALSTPYRQVKADYSDFAADLSGDPTDDRLDREGFFEALALFLHHYDLDMDWASAKSAPTEPLINSLAAALPFAPTERQALLEAASLSDRCAAMIALMRINAARPADDHSDPLQ
jgi:Lon protease-like protein